MLCFVYICYDVANYTRKRQNVINFKKNFSKSCNYCQKSFAYKYKQGDTNTNKETLCLFTMHFLFLYFLQKIQKFLILAIPTGSDGDYF